MWSLTVGVSCLPLNSAEAQSGTRAAESAAQVSNIALLEGGPVEILSVYPFKEENPEKEE